MRTPFIRAGAPSMNALEVLQLRAQWIAARLSYGLTNYRHALRAPAMAAIFGARRRTPISTTPLECVELYQAVRATDKTAGDLAEAGVYLGGTALVMLAASSKRLHLFDTFEGMPHGGGILLSHDYPLSPGVVRAFDEFFAGRPEPFVPLSGNQALAIKP